MIKDLSLPQIDELKLENMCCQRDTKIAHTARASMEISKQTFQSFHLLGTPERQTRPPSRFFLRDGPKEEMNLTPEILRFIGNVVKHSKLMRASTFISVTDNGKNLKYLNKHNQQPEYIFINYE